MKKVVVLLLSLTVVLFAAGGCALPGTAAKSADRRTEYVSDNMKLRMRRTYRIMGPKRFAKLIGRERVQLLDVRTAREYRFDHIVGANGCLNITFQRINFVNLVKRQLDPARRVAVYCRAGNQSSRAAETLARAGFRVIYLQGGLQSWVALGYPTVNTLRGYNAVVAAAPPINSLSEEEE
ncbi:MAG: rhodanese-like domain-containing protein [Bacteroidales bacterium]|jgi:rhodanese-related sulfurtransferase|nr:rhodanese-like domain-containing protein [Bacteroidota bacterium]NLN99362.1 rhodanese-like domain-containing protein [Bacteroidales bacterium]